MTDSLRAFIDFVRENPEAIGETDSAEQGIKVLNALAESQPVPQLVPATYHPLFGDKLLLHLNGLVAGTKNAQEFYRAVADLSQEFVGVAWETVTAADILAEADIRDLIEHCPALLDDSHILLGKIDVDRYWARRVRRYLVRGDYRRTWDELNKARRGFTKPNDVRPGTISHDQRDDIGEVVFKSWDAYACSKEMLAELVADLFSAMEKNGLIAPISEEDKTLPGQKMPRRVFETKPTKGGRVIRSYELSGVTVSGFGFACIFRLKAGYMYPRRQGDGCPPKLHVFDETGAQVLKIAAYFSKKKDERRRKKHEDALCHHLEELKAER